jgi:hypothetical protein
MSEFTKGDWYVYGLGIDFGVGVGFSGISICELKLLSDDVITKEENTSNANLISAAPNMYAMVESLSHELNMAIDEINTMRDIHHTDNLTPADHWDKESLHDAQVLLAKARGDES